MEINKLMEENLCLLNRLIELRHIKEVTNNKEDEIAYDKCFAKALVKFNYIVEVNTYRYKKFSNYNDLFQEGKIGLVISLMKFDPNRSKNFFKLANWYIKTRISRAANKHDVVNAPLLVSDKVIMNRLNTMPIMIEYGDDAETCVEKEDAINNLKLAIECLSEIQKNIVCMYYGISINNRKFKKTSISGIAKTLKKQKKEIEIILEQAHKELSKNKSILELMED